MLWADGIEDWDELWIDGFLLFSSAWDVCDALKIDWLLF